MLAEVMAEAGWCFDDVELFVTTLGPGSFTGIRAGVAASRALALSTGKPAFGVTTLEAMAASIDHEGPRTCILRGRQGTVYAQRFAADGLAVTDAVAMRETAVLDLCEPGDLLLIDATDGLEGAMQVTIDGPSVARAAMIRIGHGEPVGSGFSLHPVYLRDPGARLGAGRPLVSAA